MLAASPCRRLPAEAHRLEVAYGRLKDERTLLAVSGGPDSTALMHVAALLSEATGTPRPAVACVDHGLRPESRAEAEGVVRAAAALGLRAAVLTWQSAWRDGLPRRGVAEQARAARYRLLAAEARRIGATHIVTAHTLDDQAETVLMRMARGSGLTGLAAMQAERDLDCIVLARPFLGVPKNELVALCQAQGWAFVQDASNRDEASTRVRWRRLAPALAREGLTAGRLARLAARLARADAALDRMAASTIDAAMLGQDGLGSRWRFPVLADQPDEILLRGLGQILACGRDGAPMRLERLETLAVALRTAHGSGAPLRRTLAGQVVALDRSGVLTVTPETARRRGCPAGKVSDPAPKDRRVTFTGRSLGKATPSSYIASRDATARGADAVETHCISAGEVRDVLLSAGRK